MNSAVLPQRRMVGLTQGQISDQSNDRFDQGPAGGRVQEVDNGLNAVVEAHSILRHLGFHVAGCEVAQGADLR